MTGHQRQDRRAAAAIARLAVQALHAELNLYPKPGLVSPVDSGSHADMHVGTFMRSLFSLRRYFADIAFAGATGAGFDDLARLGRAAERRMLAATGGVNTHRGAIFCLGLLCAAMGRVRADHAPMALADPADIRAVLLAHWGADLAQHARARQPGAHGTSVALVHAIGGARTEAAAGMPSLFEVALPALQRTLAAGRGWQAARIDAFFALLAVLEDTNVYHRGGAAGAELVREHGARFIARGGTAAPDWQETARASHRLFVARRLSPGGAADLLAATCLVHAACMPAEHANRANHGSHANHGNRSLRRALPAT